MKVKNIFSASLVFLAVVTVALFFKIGLWQRSDNAEQYFSKETDKFCVNLLCLEKIDGEWFVLGPNGKVPASNDVVGNFLDNASEINLVDIASENPDKFSQLGIGGAETVVLDIRGKRLEIGGNTKNYDGTFVRKENGDVVYRVDKILAKKTLSDWNYWVNKTITNLPQYQINKVSIKYGSKTSEKLPVDGKWGNDEFINLISSLKSVKYLPDFVPGAGMFFDYLIEYENNKTELKIGKGIGVGISYWATTSNKYYYEIKKEDFDLLTAGLK